MNKSFHILFFVLVSHIALSQEGLRPLTSNMNYIYPDLHPKAEKPNTSISNQKPSAVSLSLPFVEDFYYSSTSNYPDPAKWMDSAVYVNSGMGIAPLSIGVATFDGLDKHGYPYNPSLTNLTKSDSADKLTSQPINLYTSGSQTLSPADNVLLSFYYQARGNGDVPEASDSLLVDFFQPIKKKWVNVWYQNGSTSSNTLDTAFKRVFLKIQDTAYFHTDFQFRFRNYASVTGNFDHWNVDYIFLDKNRPDTLADTVRYDITIAGIPTSFLKDYSAMPLQQFIPSEMAKRTNVRIRNNYGTKLNLGYKYRVFDMYYNPLFSEYDGGFLNLNPFWLNHEIPAGHGYSKDTTHAHPLVKDTFVINKTTSVYFPIKHYVFLNGSATADEIRQNDTVIQYQRFSNYYAFDDGSAEAGYYVNKALAKIAVKIKVNKIDSLSGLRIYFDPVGNVSTITNTNTVYNFTLNVWSDDGTGNPVNSPPYYKDSATYHPQYIQTGFKEIPEYRFKKPVILDPGTYFIGIQQSSSILTIGFDKNYDHRKNLYFDSGSGFEQSQEGGSIMMQPFFGTYYAYVGIKELTDLQKNKFLVYPNPTSEQLNIVATDFENTSYQIYNSLGQLIKGDKIESSHQTVSTSEMEAGIYILILKNKGQAVQQQKIIVQH